MITTGAKFFFGLAALALAGAAVFAWSNHGGLAGVLTGGLYGGVGDHAGYAVLLAAAARRFFPRRSRARVPRRRRRRGRVARRCRHVARGARASEQQLLAGARRRRRGVLCGRSRRQPATVRLRDPGRRGRAARVDGVGVVRARDRRSGRQPADPQPRHPARRDPGVRRDRHRRARVLYLPSPAWRSARTPPGSSRSASPRSCLLLGWVFAASPKSTRTAIAVICILGFLGVIAGGVISAAQGSRDYEKHEQEKPFVPPDRNQPIPTSLPEN